VSILVSQTLEEEEGERAADLRVVSLV